MKNKNNGSRRRIIFSFLGGVSILIGWAEFLFKPVRHYAKENQLTLLESLADLLSIQPSAYDWPMSGYVFLLSSALILYLSISLMMRPVRSALDFFEGSEAPISILKSDIEIYVEDFEMKSVVTRRSQILHSNREGVDAYHYNMSSLHGTIPETSLIIDSRINNEKITKEILTVSSGKKLDAVEVFARGLPTNFFATYLPDSFVRFIFDHTAIFHKSLLIRKSQNYDIDEYSVRKPMFQIMATRYPVSLINITFNLPIPCCLKQDSIRAFLIMSQAVREIGVSPINDTAGRVKYRVEIRKLKQEQAIRLVWENNLPAGAT